MSEQPDGSRPPADIVTRILEVVSGVLMILITGIVIYAVTARYVFNRPPIWSEDVPRVLFVWMTYVAVIAATKRDLNIRVTFIVDKLSRSARFYVQSVMNALVLVMLVILAVYSVPVIELNLESTMLTTGWSDVVSYLPLPIACLGMAVITLQRMYRDLLRHRSGEAGR